MTEDAPSTGDTSPTPADQPPSVAPADASGDRPVTESPAPPTPPPNETAAVGSPPPPGSTTPSIPSGSSPPAAAPVVPPPAPPAAPPPGLAAPERSDRSDRPGIGLLPVAVGVGLLAAAVMISATRSRADGDLDWSNYTVGLGGTAALLLAALAALLLGSGGGRKREELVTWPGSVGILGVGVVLAVGLEDVGGADDWLAYLVGGVVVLLSLVGYAAVRRGAFVVTAILGLGLAYVQLSDDVIFDIGEEDDRAIIAAATIAVFVLAVTALGWLLRTRALSGVVVGVIGVVGFNVVLLALVVMQTLGQIFGDVGMAGLAPGGEAPSSDYDDDVYVILAMAAVLTLLWAIAAALDGNPGFTVLAIAMPASLVPMATFVLAVEHPTWWGVGFAAAGALLLAAVGLRQLLGRKRAH